MLHVPQLWMQLGLEQENVVIQFMPWIGVYHGEIDVIQWTWYFFHITSGRINTWNGVNQLKELFFLI